MKVVIISISDTFFDRVRLLKKYYESKGHQVTVVTSDFSHRQKQKIDYLDSADILVDTMEYSRNLSARRLISHSKFACKIEKLMEELSPDIIHSIIPANSLCRSLARYKLHNPNIKLYFDINDLWPEALPIHHFQWFPVFSAWRNLRDRYLETADHVFVECELFLDGLKDPEKCTVLHFARSQEPMRIERKLSTDKLELVYLGSINNIIDIDLIRDIAVQTSKYKPTIIHIIGEGENKNRLVTELSSTDAEVIDHGVIFDMDEKQQIFNRCHYGLNIMKSDVMVGLTMKSLDYMIGGVPLLNSIGGDTKKLVNEYDLGWNINRNDLEDLAKNICSEDLESQYRRRKNVQSIYKEYFSEKTFFKTLDEAEI